MKGPEKGDHSDISEVCYLHAKGKDQPLSRKLQAYNVTTCPNSLFVRNVCDQTICVVTLSL